jgi:hypothetical protein
MTAHSGSGRRLDNLQVRADDPGTALTVRSVLLETAVPDNRVRSRSPPEGVAKRVALQCPQILW